MIAAPRIERVLLGPRGTALAVAWGFAEGTLFFIVPDILLKMTALFSFRRSILQMLAVTGGALIAGTIMFIWSSQSPTAARAVEHVPFVGAAMLQRVDRIFGESGGIAMLQGPLSGIPYKAYAVEAPGKIDIGIFLLLSIPARLERFVITWVMFAALGAALRPRKKNYTTLALIVHAVYWCGVYAVYWTVI